MATVDKLIERLWQSPAGTLVVEEEEAAAKADRLAHIVALAALEKRELAELPPLLKAREAAQKQHERAVEATKATAIEFNLAAGAVANAHVLIDRSRSDQKLALEASASGSIQVFIGRLESECQRLQRAAPDQIEGRDARIDKRIVYSNIYRIRDRIRAIGPAIEAAHSLKYVDSSPAALEKHFSRIWDSLPTTEVDMGGA